MICFTAADVNSRKINGVLDTSQAPRNGAVFRLYRDIWQLLSGRRRLFAGAVTLLIAAQLILLLNPYLSGKALNALQLHGTAGLAEASRWLCSALLLAGVSWMFHGPARLLERNAALTIRQRMSSKLIGKLFDLPLSWHESHHSGETAHRVQQSTQALANFTQSQFIYLNSAVRLIGPLAALFWVHPAIGSAATAGFALIIFSVAGFDRAMLRLAKLENNAERRYAAALIDSLGNSSTVYALRQARLAGVRLEHKLLAVFGPLKKSIVLNEAKWCTVDLATRTLNCCLVGLFVWLSTRVTADAGIGHALLLGSLYMVWEYSQQAAGVVSSIASHFQTFARQHADYASAEVIYDAVPCPPTPPVALRDVSWHRMAVGRMTFKYGIGRSNVAALQDLSFSLERGKRYAVIGSSGSGKSTVLRLLAGLYPAEHVDLTLDDGPVCCDPAMVAQTLRAGATLIPQDAEVYEGTLAENLGLCESVLGVPERAEYPMAIRVACAEDFLEAAPLGIETAVAERAANWSGGQRSRMALARGILAAKGSLLVLMDEPTASLDPATELRVLRNLFDFFAQACIVTSIHRLSLLGEFDGVLVMREGRLVAQGTPDDLALTCEEFRRLTSRGLEDAEQSKHSAEAVPSLGRRADHRSKLRTAVSSQVSTRRVH